MRDWEKHQAIRILENHLETHFWIESSAMTDKEKANHPGWEAREGYLKHLTLKEAWANMWPNLTDANKQIFFDLPNFNAKKFKEITGIELNKEN